MNKTLFILSALAITFLCQLQASLGADPSAQIAIAAEKITQVLLDKDRETVSLSSITSKTAKGNIGPGLLVSFQQEFERINAARKLKKQKFVSIVGGSDFKIRGSFDVIDDPDDLGSPESQRLLTLKVTIEIFDGADVVFPHTFFSDRLRDIIPASGLTARLDPKSGSNKEDHKVFRQTVKKVATGEKTFAVNGTRIKSSQNSEFEVEILTGSPADVASGDYSVRAPKKSSGIFPLVPINIGEVYAVKIYNKANHEIAVSMKIDGIDQFAFSKDRNPETGRPRFSSWIIAPNSEFVIRGWHQTIDPKSKKNLSAFVVTKYGDGISQFIDVDRKQNGVISVAFAKASFPGSKGSRNSAETGFGPPIKQNQRAVKRTIDPPHDFVSIRYTR